MIRLLLRLFCANMLILRTHSRIETNSQGVTIGEICIPEYIHTNDSLWTELELHQKSKKELVSLIKDKWNE